MSATSDPGTDLPPSVLATDKVSKAGRLQLARYIIRGRAPDTGEVSYSHPANLSPRGCRKVRARGFPPPWTVDETDTWFIVTDAPGRRSARYFETGSPSWG